MDSCPCVGPWTVASAFLNFSSYKKAGILLALLTSWAVPEHSLLSCVRLFVTPWTATRQASVSFTVSRSLLRLMSIELMMPTNNLILCHSLLPSIFPSIRGFSNESVLCIRWPKYWSFSFGISTSSEY